MASRSMASVIGTAFLLLILIHTILSTPNEPPSKLSTRRTPNNGNQIVGVGMDLTADYGTVALSLPNDVILNVAKIKGSEKYKDMLKRMSRLPQRPVKYPASLTDYLKEYWRDFWWGYRRSKGLPATKDIGLLAQMIRELQVAAETRLGFEVTTVRVATINLGGIWVRDVNEALRYLGLTMTQEGYESWNKIAEEDGAWHGHGFGLCEHYRNRTRCKEESQYPPGNHPVCVHYTKGLFALTSAWVYSGWGPFPPAVLDRGSDELDRQPEEECWEDIRQAVNRSLDPWSRPYKVLLIGEDAGSKTLRDVLTGFFYKKWNAEPEFGYGDPTWVVARGLAEVAKRQLYYEQEAESLGSGETSGKNGL